MSDSISKSFESVPAQLAADPGSSPKIENPNPVSHLTLTGNSYLHPRTGFYCSLMYDYFLLI